jgi:hypothetical protein
MVNDGSGQTTDADVGPTQRSKRNIEENVRKRASRQIVALPMDM